MQHIKIIQGDLTTAKVDAIVNAANSRMLGGGGVDGAIHRAAGPELLEACYQVPEINGQRCPVGEARITPGFRLPAQYVIHTVGPVYHSDPTPEKHLSAAYISYLQLAYSNNCQSVAFPAISCGVYGYPHERAAEIALAACNQKPFSDMEIFFYLFGDDICSVWQSVYQKQVVTD